MALTMELYRRQDEVVGLSAPAQPELEVFTQSGELERKS
jgi:hypothetical protein